MASLQQEVADRIVSIVKKDASVIGLAAAGSYITNELDAYADLDLVVVSQTRMSDDREKMVAFARSLGDLVVAFTGEHVGEPRLLVCLYDNPLVHVDIKFLVPEEFENRVEDPVILFEREQALTTIIRRTTSSWPQPDLQWIEDRFWVWVHYLGTKLGRGELFECLDGLNYLRSQVLSPLLQLKNKLPARGMRRLETRLNAADLENLKITVASYSRSSIVKAIDNSISIYRNLRRNLFDQTIILQTRAEKESLAYWKKIKLPG